MKNLNFFSILIGAIIGIASTILITNFFFPENNYSAFPGKEVELKKIKASDVEKILDDYIHINKDSILDTCVYKMAINVSKQQYEVMHQAIARMTSNQLNDISGFRLYFARKETNNGLYSILYNIDNNYIQREPQFGILKSQIFPEKYALECPPFCNRQ